MAISPEIDIDAYLATFNEDVAAGTIPSVVQEKKTTISEEKPTLLPVAPLPKRETIAFDLFDGSPGTARVVRKWVLEKAKGWPSYGDWNGTLELLASEGFTNGIRYGLPQKKVLNPLPIEMSVVREPDRDGNLLVALGDWRYNVLRKSAATNSQRGLELAKGLSVQAGFARPAMLRDVDGTEFTHVTGVPKAYWFEIGDRTPTISIYTRIPKQRRSH